MPAGQKKIGAEAPVFFNQEKPTRLFQAALSSVGFAQNSSSLVSFVAFGPRIFEFHFTRVVAFSRGAGWRLFRAFTGVIFFTRC